MTTYHLADLLDHLRQGFGDNLKAQTSTALQEAVAAFREFPDQTLKSLIAGARKANAPQPAVTGGRAPAASPAGVIERIQAIHAGSAPAGEAVNLKGLTNPQLQEVLRAFKATSTGKKADLEAGIRKLCVQVEQPAGPPALPRVPNAGATEALDLKAVEEGVRIYSALRDDRTRSLADVRAGFEPLRAYPKPVVEEISRCLKVTPFGSRTEVLDQLLANLLGLKMGQYRADQILTGT